MKKKFKLFVSILSLCVSLAVLCFGIYAAVKVDFNLSGVIKYEITEAYVDISTQIYASQVKTDSKGVFDNIEALLKNQSNGSLQPYVIDKDLSYNSTNETEETVDKDITGIELDGYYSYYFVISITNLAQAPVFAYVQEPTEMPENVYQLDTGLLTYIDYNDTQKLIIALTIENYGHMVDFGDFTTGISVEYGEGSEYIETPEGLYYEYSYCDAGNWDFYDEESYYLVVGGTTDAPEETHIGGMYSYINSIPVIFTEVYTDDLVNSIEFPARSIIDFGWAQNISFEKGSQFQNVYSEDFGEYGSLEYLYSDSPLQSIDMSNCTQLTEIAYYMFYKATELTEISFPSSITSISSEAFMETPWLANLIEQEQQDEQADGFVVVESANSSLAKYLISTVSEKLYDYCQGVVTAQHLSNYKAIAGDAFYECFALTEITIPEKFYSLFEADYAFAGTGLTEIEIPDGITKIGHYAFQECRSLTEIEIPDSVTEIGSGLFWGCRQLTKVNFPNGITEIPSSMFYESGITKIEIPNSVTTIGSGAFKRSKLTEIDIPNGVTTIGLGAFEDANLTEIHLPSSIQSIGDYALSGCKTLQTITMDDNSKYRIEGNCLIDKATNIIVQGCTGSIIPTGITTIGEDAFRYSGITQIEFPNTLTTIESSAFYHCSIQKVTIPSTIKFEDSVFRDCEKLEEVEILDGVTEIPSYTFSNCSKLQSIEIPSSVTSIGEYAFEYCYKLSEIIIPSSVTSIGRYAFDDTLWLTNLQNQETQGDGLVIIESSDNTQFKILISVVDSKLGTNRVVTAEQLAGVKVIADRLFNNSKNLIEITLPSSVTIVPESLFIDCKTLKKVTLPNTITKIEYAAFLRSSSLTTINIPSSVTTIEHSAFDNTPWLTNLQNLETQGDGLVIVNASDNPQVKFLIKAVNSKLGSKRVVTAEQLSGVKAIAGEAFYSCLNLVEITIPNTVTSIENRTFYASSLNKITIPNSVTSIGAEAFFNTKLTSITIPSSVSKIYGSAFEVSSLTEIIFQHNTNSTIEIVKEVDFNYTKDTAIVKFASGTTWSCDGKSYTTSMLVKDFFARSKTWTITVA